MLNDSQYFIPLGILLDLVVCVLPVDIIEVEVDVNVPEDVIILVLDPEPRADPDPTLRSLADFSIANLPLPPRRAAPVTAPAPPLLPQPSVHSYLY